MRAWFIQLVMVVMLAAMFPSSPAHAAPDVCKQGVMARVQSQGWEKWAFHAALGGAVGAGLGSALTVLGVSAAGFLAWTQWVPAAVPDSTRVFPVALILIGVTTVAGAVVWGVAGPFVTAVLDGLKC